MVTNLLWDDGKCSCDDEDGDDHVLIITQTFNSFIHFTVSFLSFHLNMILKLIVSKREGHIYSFFTMHLYNNKQ